MSTQEEFKANIPDVKKALGSFKITFVLGGPASGKGTQCAKLVEEFGYTHLSVGDLFRAEVKKASKEGEIADQIMKSGGLVPYKLTVQVLANAMIDHPSKNYLIDGFPRDTDQALFFESKIAEAQTILFYNTPREVCMARCMERAKTSGRADDTAEIIEKRLQTYEDQSRPVVDLYRKFGKVREVDGSGSVFEVWNATRKAMLPQVSFMVGPKSTNEFGASLAARSNQKLLDFENFLTVREMQEASDDDKVLALIQHLADEPSARVLLSGFPLNHYQAKFFVKNATHPHSVFVLNCSKDFCQAEMLKVDEHAPEYIPSSELNQRIGQYNNNMKDLLPYLLQNTDVFEIDIERQFQSSFREIAAKKEPTVILVRSSGTPEGEEARAGIMEGLQEQGYQVLDVKELKNLAIDRGTQVGRDFQECKKANVEISLLKSIIYAGSPQDKFVVRGFPDSIESSEQFEKECVCLSAVIYATAKGLPTVEVKGDDLTRRGLDTLFAKEFRLKPMENWDHSTFEQHLGRKVSWALITGRKYSGKTTVAAALQGIINGKAINMEAIRDELKNRGADDEEAADEKPDPPLEEVEERIIEIIDGDRQKGHKFTYLFDSWLHADADAFLKYMWGEYGQPSFSIDLNCNEKVLEERCKLKNEIEGDLDDDRKAEMEADAAKHEKTLEECQLFFEMSASQLGTVIRRISIQSDGGKPESTVRQLREHFNPRVVVVNHERRFDVDTACSNLAIKFGMTYISVSQLIKHNIESHTALGTQLQASCKPKVLVACDEADDSNSQFSAVHYDANLVMKLVKETVAAKGAGNRYILLEGFFNSRFLENQHDQLALRAMDELFMIEKELGQVAGIISLQSQAEPVNYTCEQWEEFEAPPEKEVKEPQLDENGQPIDPPAEQPPAEGEEQAKPKFNPADYRWTVTDKQARNLPQIFADFKGASAKLGRREASEVNECMKVAQTACLNEFVEMVIFEENSGTSLYEQVVFN